MGGKDPWMFQFSYKRGGVGEGVVTKLLGKEMSVGSTENGRETVDPGNKKKHRCTKRRGNPLPCGKKGEKKLG